MTQPPTRERELMDRLAAAKTPEQRDDLEAALRAERRAEEVRRDRVRSGRRTAPGVFREGFR